MNAAHSTPERNRLLARIHALGKNLLLEEDEYRALVMKITGKDSAALLDMRELGSLAGYLQKLWNRQRKPKHGYSGSYTFTPQEKLIWSLWQQLADQGKIKNRKMAGLMGYVKAHIARVDHISWLNGAQQDMLIEQLKKFLQR